MKIWNLIKLAAACLAIASYTCSVYSAVSQQTLNSLTTPSSTESKIGMLEFKDGYPTADTASKLRDEIDYLHGVEAFMNSARGVSAYAIYKGLQEAGVKDNEVIIFSKLMDSNSLFLTANADTIYYMSFIDLSNGPVVFESPPKALGIIDDMWFRWISDFGLPGGDRGKGGKYLIVPPYYKGELPEGGYYVRKSRTNKVMILGRSFLTNNDPAPTVSVIKNSLKIYPYTPGGVGTSIGNFLEGKSKILGKLITPKAPRFVEGTGLSMNTIMPNNFSYFQMLNELVQSEPASALEVETAGQFEAIGISKGKEFKPDSRLQNILKNAVVIGNASSRMLGMGADPENKFRYYDNSSIWWIPLWVGGFEFINPPPMIENNQVKPFPNSQARKLGSRTSFFYAATGITPAMCMRLTNIGSQYLLANIDNTGAPFDGSKIYKVTLPKNIPAARFWSLTLYDNQTRSMLQTPQRYPRAGSQSYPSPSAEQNQDGSTTIYFSPQLPSGVSAGNWIQTDPKKGWFTVLRLYSPLQSFFDKSWRMGEIELVKS